MTVRIKPIVHNSEHYVSVVMDGQPMERHGPFTNAGEAEAMAVQFAAICRGLHAEVAMAAPRLRRSRHG
jgi:hypothetical protein